MRFQCQKGCGDLINPAINFARCRFLYDHYVCLGDAKRGHRDIAALHQVLGYNLTDLAFVAGDQQFPLISIGTEVTAPMPGERGPMALTVKIWKSIAKRTLAQGPPGGFLGVRGGGKFQRQKSLNRVGASSV